jgi:peroxiredoxin Q/BCP
MRKTLLTILGLFATTAQALEVGSVAPPFTARNQDGKKISLSDYTGKAVLLYFYPKDETPGCTKEACEFRDKFAEFKKHGAIVLGVSSQDEKSHRKFKDHHHLPFDLLADTDGTIAKAYGVGKFPVVGFFKRQSVLIGKDGRVFKYYEEVDPDKHADQALKDLNEMDHH